MPDRHIALLRSVARARQRALRTHDAAAEDHLAARARRGELDDRARRTRSNLDAAVARRSLAERAAMGS